MRNRQMPGQTIDNLVAFLTKRFPEREFNWIFEPAIGGFSFQSIDIVTGRCDVKFIENNESLGWEDHQQDLNDRMFVWVTDIVKEEQ